jgi:hypothetical protein
VEFLRSTADACGNDDSESRDGPVAGVEYGGFAYRRLNQDFVSVGVVLSGIYCLAVLAFTPCGDQFSLEQWWKKRKTIVRPAFAYAYPILLMQLLMAWTYFSSCLLKLRAGGFGYLSQDNLPSLAIYHSLDNLHDTAFRLAFWLPQYKAYLPVVMAVVLVWEFLFPLAVFFPRWRWLMLGGGVVFHLSTLFFMNIFFPHQLALYPIFINWDRFRKTD